MGSSGRSCVDGGGAPPESARFPAGLRVLVVDDDPICLKIVEVMLMKCLYDVTTCSRAVIALSMLRERKGRFDLVLSDVYMPDMDGFKLLEHIGLEMDLPVIMMSADDGKDVVMKGVTHGACDYLIKPVRMEALKTIWQHVVRKKRNELKELEHSGSVEESDKQKRQFDEGDNASSVNEGSCKNVKRRKEGKEEEDEIEEHEDSSALKKPRVVWSADLHQQFVAAVSKLGVDKAVPKRILELMNVPGITRENVASHLQKYRLYLRRVSVSQHQDRFDIPFTGATESGLGSRSSLDGIDLQALAVLGQLAPQNLIAMHAGPPKRVANTATGISAVDQISFLNPNVQTANSSRIRTEPGQLLNNRQMSLLCGPSSLGTSSSYPNGHLNNSSAMKMTQRGQPFFLSQQQNHTIDMQCQPQWRGQSLNGLEGELNSRVSSTIEQNRLSNEISGQVSGRGGTIVTGNTSLAGTYMNTSSYVAVPQAQYAEFQRSCTTDSAGSCYSLVSSIGTPNNTSTGMLQEIVPASGTVEAFTNKTNLKEVKDFIPSYDPFGEPRHSRDQDWKLQHINLSYESAQHVGSKRNNIDFGLPILDHQDFNATLKDGSSRNTCNVRKENISLRAESERKVGFIAQYNNTFLADNSVRIKAESMQDPSCHDVLFPDNDELMSVVGPQQQQGIGQGEAEFNFDGYPLDDILV